MKKCLFWAALALAALGCGKKKADLSGETPVKISDFLAAFPKLAPNFSVADTNINRLADTVTIGYKAFAQFVPDSALTAITGSAKKAQIHPVGTIEKERELYLLANFVQKKTTKLAVFVMDKKHKYLASKELMNTAHNDGYMHTVSINREPTFLIGKEKTDKDNTLRYSRTGWVYTSSGVFMVVVNDSNEESARSATVINPIDTLPRKNKYSGDYMEDKRNFISIRDTKKPNVYQFFIHFEKEENCTGELKGEMKMRDANTAIFSENGDPCVIDFSFEGSRITVKEKGSCGNHRGIKCFFDDTYEKRKKK